MAIIYTYPIKTTSANRNDLILISDSADKNKTKQISVAKLPGGIDFVGVGGNGTAGKIPKWSTQYDLTDSSISEDSVTGNIGIGQTNPNAQLDIKDTASQTAIRVINDTYDNYLIQKTRSDNTQILGIQEFGSNGGLSLVTGGSQRLNINNLGNVGIKTSTPLATLDVAGSIRLTGTQIFNSTGSGTIMTLFDDTVGRNNRILIGANASGAFVNSSFSSGGTQNLILNSSGGYVGIGTTAPDSVLTVKAATANVGIPVIKSSVNGFNNGFTLIGDNYVAGESQFNLGISYSGANGVLSRSVKVSNTTDDVFLSSQDAYSTNPSAFILDRDGSFRFLNTSTNASTPVGTAVSLSERMRINSSGNVGIDNTNPSRKLTVGSGNQVIPALPLTVSNGFQSNWVSKLFFGSAIDWYRIAKIPQKNVARGGGILKFSLTGGNTGPTTYVINYWKYYTASVGTNSHTLKLEQYGPNLAFTKARISLATDGEVYIEVYKNATIVFNSPPPVFHDSLLGYDGYQAEIIVSDSTNTLPSGSSGGSMEELPFISMGTSVKAIHVENTLNSVGNINLKNLPTSASGLVAGDIYNDGGTLKIFS
jgi:hypothetical protein